MCLSSSSRTPPAGAEPSGDGVSVVRFLISAFVGQVVAQIDPTQTEPWFGKSGTSFSLMESSSARKKPMNKWLQTTCSTFTSEVTLMSMNLQRDEGGSDRSKRTPQAYAHHINWGFWAGGQRWPSDRVPYNRSVGPSLTHLIKAHRALIAMCFLIRSVGPPGLKLSSFLLALWSY